MFPRFALSTIIPQMGYSNILPLNRYAAEMLASNSVSPNRRSKIFLNGCSLSPTEHALNDRAYGARCMKGCQIEPQRTFKAMYLSEVVMISSTLQ